MEGLQKDRFIWKIHLGNIFGLMEPRPSSTVKESNAIREGEMKERPVFLSRTLGYLLKHKFPLYFFANTLGF